MLNITTNKYNSDSVDSVSIGITNCITGDEFIARVYQMDLQIFKLKDFYNLINKIWKLELGKNHIVPEYKLVYRQVSETHMLMQVGMGKLGPLESVILEQTD